MDPIPLYSRRGLRGGTQVRRTWWRRRCIPCTPFACRPARPIRSTSLRNDPERRRHGRQRRRVLRPARRSSRRSSACSMAATRSSSSAASRVGERCVANARYVDVHLKEGKSGTLLLVTIETTFHHGVGRAAARQPANADLEMRRWRCVGRRAVGAQRRRRSTRGRSRPRISCAGRRRSRTGIASTTTRRFANGARQAARRADQRVVEAARAGAAREGRARPRRLAVEDQVSLQEDGRRLGHDPRGSAEVVAKQEIDGLGFVTLRGSC